MGKTDFITLFESLQSKKDLVIFIRLLSESFVAEPETWENLTIDQYLESIASWIEDSEFLETEKSSLANSVCKGIAQTMYVGKIYE